MPIHVRVCEWWQQLPARTQPMAFPGRGVQAARQSRVCQCSPTFRSRPQIINSFSKSTQGPLFLRHTSSYRLQRQAAEPNHQHSYSQAGKGSYWSLDFLLLLVAKNYEACSGFRNWLISWFMDKILLLICFWPQDLETSKPIWALDLICIMNIHSTIRGRNYWNNKNIMRTAGKVEYGHHMGSCDQSLIHRLRLHSVFELPKSGWQVE